ncbi:spermine synthase [Lysobacter sp. CFH 32150]|uniref:spermine/spermidine synthase domain-containing protein n=1 Tax=Lysobacter sp. CFH 32150 TaxID=2927128 RepID=UPI001FA8118F|nr:spermine synthase [Lysobacter sp. CFH 32150]MCI4567738.1 spermine synthase [Lysobacter sp. CFH 32150]
MHLSTKRAGHALLLLFVLSGFAGLIYQSVWSHYLGLTLGHAAYAQSLVLAIFMGGMALGAWLASRFSLNWRSLILAYAVIEVGIGVAGLLFHPIFVGYMALSTSTVLPGLTSPQLAHGWQWLSAAMLIAPQCVLLGATFPILSAGYMRLAPDEAGPILGGLYFSNSLGAAAGALVTAFLLLPTLGMPGSMLVAGALNLLVGVGAWAVWRQTGDGASAAIPTGAPMQAAAVPTAGRGFVRLILLAAAITGATSFVYEIGWVRMLNQALGTTVHAFELMLAAFILGLAFGGLWVRRRCKSESDAVAMAGYAQILMGIAALVSIPMFNQSFRWVGWLMHQLVRDDTGYAWFSAGSGAIAMAVMFPAAFFAGMTLPLFTLALLRRGVGESSIGRVYAANTLGAIIGVFVMVHLLVPGIGVRLAVTLAALFDVALGLYLLRRVSPGRATRGYALASMAVVAAALVSLHFGKPDPHKQVAGVFRTGNWRVDESMRIPYLRDGKTATVSVATDADARAASIATNGKPDASLALNLSVAPQPDEVTMLMAAALPLALHPDPRRVAVIGWGSGLTTHTLLGSPVPRVVESVEIERAMYDGARLFGERVARGYDDPRSKIRIEDARTYFATSNRRYDVIVSEPSNPWVSGVASLFTEEFYGFIHRHLEEDGILVQWVQSYELNDQLLGTMISALLQVFPQTDVYVTNRGDLLMVASRDRAHAPNWAALAAEPLRSELQRVGLGSSAEFQLRRIGGPATLRNLVKLTGATPHSDYYPTVSLQAPRARFKGESADFLLYLTGNGLPVQDILGERVPPGVAAVIADTGASEAHMLALSMRSSLLAGRVDDVLRQRWPSFADAAEQLFVLSAVVVDGSRQKAWSQALTTVSENVTGILPREDVAMLFDHPAWLANAAQQPVEVRTLLAMHAAAARRDASEMLRVAMQVLEQRRDRIARDAREQALVVAMLGAVGTGKPALVATIERQYGPDIPPTQRCGRMRSWLLSWVDGAE